MQLWQRCSSGSVWRQGCEAVMHPRHLHSATICALKCKALIVKYRPLIYYLVVAQLTRDVLMVTAVCTESLMYAEILPVTCCVQLNCSAWGLREGAPGKGLVLLLVLWQLFQPTPDARLWHSQKMCWPGMGYQFPNFVTCSWLPARVRWPGSGSWLGVGFALHGFLAVI